MQEVHRLLQRQLKRYSIDLALAPAAWKGFIAMVNDAYWQADEDRTRLERSLELSSQELLQANEQMQSLLHSVEAQVAERTAQLTASNAELEQALHELQQTQAQLVQTEKMSSLGQLVAGIAHEINNPVNFIYGNLTYVGEYAQTLLDLVHLYGQHYPNPVPAVQTQLEDSDLHFLAEDLNKLLTSMHMGADRIKQIVLSLRNFSRMEEAEMKPVNLHEGIDSTLLILQSRLKASGNCPAVQVIKEYGNLPLVECYAGLLNQVLMNLIVNALDALEDSQKFCGASPPLSEPETVLACELLPPMDQKGPQIWIQTEVTADDWVVIRIRDNGPGIPDAIRPRMFDPFFTTKPVGKGTGLGLSISYRIITERHHGTLTCQSTPGLGTEFVIKIPTNQENLTATTEREAVSQGVA